MNSRFTPQRNKGFSLVELAIVLVILGLLAGGILAGRSMIRASELRSVNADFSNYRAAVYAFRDKYFAYPGDMTNATAFWGSAGGTGSDRTCFQSSGSGTCNGDGNSWITGLVDVSPTHDWGTVSSATEGTRAWQQLANSGLVSGAYGNGSYASMRFGTSVPASKISKGGYSIANTGDGAISPWTTEIINYLLFGTALEVANGPILKPEEAWNLDSKMDDGNPSTGRVRVEPEQTDCYTGTTPNTTYVLTDDNFDCSLRMQLQ